jgi:signal transduction histidine kinase
MTGIFLLDWLALAVSLFNVILQLWLGLTVLLNADRRTWIIWLAGGGTLLGSAFFVSHTAILASGLRVTGPGVDFWWHLGWLPIIALPLVWYAAMLGYTGSWTVNIQRLGVGLTGGAALILAGLTLFANPLPSLARTDLLSTSPFNIGGLPALVAVYPIYILLCMGLALLALRHPAPSTRMMGEIARHRARPWLVTTSLLFLIVTLLVTWVMLWVTLNANAGLENLIFTIALFDLVIAALLALAVLCIGQAVAAYEVFTGKALPRHGLVRQWRNAIILAAGFSLVISLNFVSSLRPIYSLLSATLVIAAFAALSSWRTLTQREGYIRQLRPFVASQNLYDQLLERSAAADSISDSFTALCREVLGTRQAYLIPLGSLAPLAGPPLSYPPGKPPPSITHLLPHFTSPQTMSLPLDPTTHGGALWAAPLWSERGLIGVLLLGEKYDGGLYAQEEIEIARAGGERLIDTQASAEMARRLMSLQRQRLAESGLLDRRARRVIHDDVLPALHASLLSLNASDFRSLPKTSEVSASLTAAHHQLANLLHELPAALGAPEVARLGLVGALRRLVEHDLKDAFDSVTWAVTPEADSKAQSLPPLTAEVIFYAAREAMRNAARHGRADSSTALHLRVHLLWREGLTLMIEDDGVGVDSFPVAHASSLRGAGQAPGLRGSGQGLALHSTMMAVVGGTLAVESEPGSYTRVVLTLPIFNNEAP